MTLDELGTSQPDEIDKVYFNSWISERVKRFYKSHRENFDKDDASLPEVVKGAIDQISRSIYFLEKELTSRHKLHPDFVRMAEERFSASKGLGITDKGDNNG